MTDKIFKEEPIDWMKAFDQLLSIEYFYDQKDISIVHIGPRNGKYIYNLKTKKKQYLTKNQRNKLIDGMQAYNIMFGKDQSES